MKVGDLISIIVEKTGRYHTGVVLDLYDDEALIFWDDGKMQWEIADQLEIISEKT
tara:strand:+ start:39 stop:203 length:165 start_codon:yes stop_codon:yes gene_type:complete